MTATAIAVGRGAAARAVAVAPARASDLLSGRLRTPLGNLQRRVLTLPRPRKRSATCFGAFRGLGNVQRRVLMLSEASETFSGVFWSFPRPRKRSAACFDTFRALGNVQRRVLILSEPSGRLRTPANLAGGVRDAGQESRIHAENVSTCNRLSWLASLTPPAFSF